MDDPSRVVIASKAKFAYIIADGTSDQLLQGKVIAEYAQASANDLSNSIDDTIKVINAAMSGAISQDARHALEPIFYSKVRENERIATSTEFNGRNLLNGDCAGASGLEVDTDGISSSTTANSKIEFTTNATGGATDFINLYNEIKIKQDVTTSKASEVTTDVKTSSTQVAKFQFKVGAAPTAAVTDMIQIKLDEVTISATTGLKITIGASGATEEITSGVLTLDGSLFDTTANVMANPDCR